jgi:hypothetical protein
MVSRSVTRTADISVTNVPAGRTISHAARKAVQDGTRAVARPLTHASASIFVNRM